MADWRGADKEKKGRPKPPSKSGASPEVTPEYTSKGWRRPGAGASTSNAPARSTKSWKKGSSEASIPRGVSRKPIVLTTLGLGIVATCALFLWVVLATTPKIPVFVAIPGAASRPSVLGVPPFRTVNLQRFATDTYGVLPLVDTEKSEQLFKSLSEWDTGWVSHYGRYIKDLGSLSRGERVPVGGYYKNLTAYYVQGFLHRSPSSVSSASTGEWCVSWDATIDPFQENGRFFSVKSLLSSIASATAKGQIAVVGLDLRMPYVVNNLGDLGFPANELREIYDSIDNVSRDKLLVFLPCDDGEESWVAPELQSTVFGEFFFQGMAGGFADRRMDLQQFRKTLLSKVSDWVLQNRQDRQNPIVLSTPALDESIAKSLFYRPWFSLPPSIPDRSAGVVEFQESAGYWTEHQKLREAGYYRFNPVHFAFIESLLLAAEEDAEMGLGSKYRKVELLAALDKAKQEWRVDRNRNSSLIEMLGYQIQGRCEIFSQWQNETRPAPPEQFFARLKTLRTTEDKNLAVWTWLREVAETQNADLWNQVFNQSTLEKCWVECNPRDDISDWLEIRVCRILWRECDWINAKDQSVISRIFAKAVSQFARIQETVCTMSHETTPWVKESTLQLEGEFLSAIDLFILNQWDRAEQALDALEPKLRNWNDRTRTIDEAIVTRDRVFYETPHLLRTLIRFSRYATERDRFTGLASRLASLLREALIIEQRLKSPTSHEIPTARELKADFVAFKKDFVASIRVLSADSIPDTSPESVRDYRVAVRYPFLDSKLREQFYEGLKKRYESSRSNETQDMRTNTNSSAKAINSKPATRDTVEAFTSGLGSDALLAPYWKLLARSDLRSHFDREALWAENESSSMESLRDRHIGFRPWAGSIGQELVGKDEIDIKHSLQGKIPIRFNAVLDKEYRILQQERLLRARWGDGPLNANKVSYFQQLADIYSDPTAKLFASDSVLLELNLSPIKVDSTARPSATALTNNTSQPMNQAKVQWNASSNIWDGITASVHWGIGESDWSTRRRQLYTRELPVAEGRTIDSKYETLQSVNNEPSKLFLSFRGHRILVPVTKPNEAPFYEVQFKTEQNLPKLRVGYLAGSGETIVILLDCSSSMNYRDEQGKIPFDSAKGSVRRLLDLLETKYRETGVETRVVFGAFGVSVSPQQLAKSKDFEVAQAGGREMKFELRRLNKATFPRVQVTDWENTTDKSEIITGVMSKETYSSKDLSGVRELLETDVIRPTLNTPLYDAISAAIVKTGETPGRIIVFSDGLEDTQDITIIRNEKESSSFHERYRYLGVRTSSERLNLQLSAREDIQLSVFQFDHQQYFSEEASRLEQDKTSYFGQLANEKSQFLNLLRKINPGAQETDYLFKSFQDIDEAVERVFELPRVSIEFLDADRIKEGWTNRPLSDFKMPTELPEVGNIRVVLQTPGKDSVVHQKDLQLAWNSTLSLDFDSPGLRLSPIGQQRGDPNERQYQEWEGTDWKFFQRAQFDGKQFTPELFIRWKDPRQELKQAVPMPRFVVARLQTPPGSTDPRTVVLSDWAWRYNAFQDSNKFFNAAPRLMFPNVAFGNSRGEWLSDSVKCDIWCWTDEPTFVRKLSVDWNRSDTESERQSDPFRLVVLPEKNEITLEITNQPDTERYAVVCLGAIETERRFLISQDRRSSPIKESHTFRFSDTAHSEELWLIPIRELEKGSSTISHCEFELRLER